MVLSALMESLIKEQIDRKGTEVGEEKQALYACVNLHGLDALHKLFSSLMDKAIV